MLLVNFWTYWGKFVLLVDSPPASSVRVITLREEVTARQRLSSIAEYHLLGILPINHSLGPAFQFSFFSFHDFLLLHLTWLKVIMQLKLDDECGGGY